MVIQANGGPFYFFSSLLLLVREAENTIRKTEKNINLENIFKVGIGI